MHLRISKLALFDLAEAYQWFESTRPGLGDDFSLCVEEAFSVIKRTPEAFQLIKPIPARRYAMHRFSYVIYYVVDQQSIQVKALVHSKRHPSVWQIRIPH